MRASSLALAKVCCSSNWKFSPLFYLELCLSTSLWILANWLWHRWSMDEILMSWEPWLFLTLFSSNEKPSLSTRYIMMSPFGTSNKSNALMMAFWEMSLSGDDRNSSAILLKNSNLSSLSMFGQIDELIKPWICYLVWPLSYATNEVNRVLTIATIGLISFDSI